jgi:hypothetical protein
MYVRLGRTWRNADNFVRILCDGQAKVRGRGEGGRGEGDWETGGLGNGESAALGADKKTAASWSQRSRSIVLGGRRS